MGFLHDVFARFTPQPGGDARGLALALQGGGSFGAFTWGALDRLLEHGDLSLEQALAQFERGVALARECQAALKQAEQKVEILLQKSTSAEAEPFEPDAE